MNMTNLSKTQKLVLSAMVMALYIVIMYFTQSFSFGAYQIRIATSLYALSYFFPFLVFPLGLANFISNILGGLGPIDMIGGCIVGIVTTYIIVLIKNWDLNKWLIVLPIIFVPGLGVATWLSYLSGAPYVALASSLCIGQTIPSIVGVLLVQALEPLINKMTKENIL